MTWIRGIRRQELEFRRQESEVENPKILDPVMFSSEQLNTESILRILNADY